MSLSKIFVKKANYKNVEDIVLGLLYCDAHFIANQLGSAEEYTD